MTIECVPVYYAYYDPIIGNILSITNECHAIHKHCISISYEDFDRFVSGRSIVSNYRIGYVNESVNKTTLSIILQTESYVIKHKMCELITGTVSSDTELVITWDGFHKYWKISLSESCKARLKLNQIPVNFIFYIMNRNDFNFLIRTISIPSIELFMNPVVVNFASDYETDINKIYPSTKLFFESTGLIINE